ncbi:MAG: hypothetical protein KGL26_09330 [Pseudomonadota bacterium]|nr:hypothetical protein [Pseudomonadota bacterium]
MITRIDEVTEFPLCWPEAKPRAAKRVEGNSYGWNATLAAAHQKVEDEMRRIGARGFVVSMSPRHKFGSPDPGVAVWWMTKPSGETPSRLRVLACDQFAKAEVNLYAIGLTLDRMRALERYGAYTLEQALEGARPALPPPEGMEMLDWRQVLGIALPVGVDKADMLAIVNARYRRAAADAAGDEAELRRLNLAIEAARKELGNG